jgi:drug/metabolite transporter (DMT)-like permease
LKEEDVDREENFDDEIRPEDGRLRYWTFFNGEQYRLFAALAAAFFGVVWCGLYIFGAGQTILGVVLLVLALLSFGGWRLLDRQVRWYQGTGWKKESSGKEGIKIRVAIGLWLFIFVSVGLILLLQWRRGH